MAHLIGRAMEIELSTEHDFEPSHERQHGRSRVEGSPSLRGYDSSLPPPQVDGHPQADDADSHQVLLTLPFFRKDETNLQYDRCSTQMYPDGILLIWDCNSTSCSVKFAADACCHVLQLWVSLSPDISTRCVLTSCYHKGSQCGVHNSSMLCMWESVHYLYKQL